MVSKIPLCCIAMSQGDYLKARDLLDNLYQSVQGIDYSWNYTFCVRVYAKLEWGVGNYSQAEKWLTELQKIVEASNYHDASNFHNTSAALGQAKVALSTKDWDAAAEYIRLSLNIQVQTPLYFQQSFEDKYAAVSLLAVLSLALGKLEKAARLLGSADRSYQVYRLTFPLFRRQLIDQTIEDTLVALNEEIFASAWEEGKAMDLDEALAYALEVVGVLSNCAHNANNSPFQ